MKLPMPNWELANAAVKGYAEDGVKGKLGYDPETAQWHADLDDAGYEKYIANLRKRHDEICDMAKAFTEDWGDATNIQGLATGPPKESENRLALYIVDVDCNTAKGFKASNTLKELIERKSDIITFGTTCESCGKKTMTILRWESVKPQGKEEEK